MIARYKNRISARFVLLWVAAYLVATSFIVKTASAGERKFLVILATSPKQYPSTSTPPGGFANRTTIDRQYFDLVAGNDITSFAEYWEEISYGDVTIKGDTTGWLELPWAIRPPRVNPNAQTAPQPRDFEENPDQFISPSNYFNLDGDGFLTYGTGERINIGNSMVATDRDGDPEGDENGPGRAPGFQFPDFSQGGRNVGIPVWIPGERFVDVDDDGSWDALDENLNSMDWDGDNRPDLAGAWIDLNGDDQADASGSCSCAREESCYLSDSDNDGFPDCCPNGPGTCRRLGCPPTEWTDPEGNTITDCNGNLINDADDIEFVFSRDVLPYEEGTNDNGDPACVPGPGDGIPDECQYENFTSNCHDESCPPDGGNACCDNLGKDALCVEYDEDSGFTPAERCEFADGLVMGGNQDGNLDIVEPFENFLRRWDPCLQDPDGSSENFNTKRLNWVKVYDPLSSFADFPLTCGDPPSSSPTYYNDPSYIIDNYPGDPNRVITQASGRPIYAQRDPLGRSTLDCVCGAGPSRTPGVGGIKFKILTGDEDCCVEGVSSTPHGLEERRCGTFDNWNLSSCDQNTLDGCIRFTTHPPGSPEGNVCVQITSVPVGPCRDFDIDGDGGIDDTETGVCVAGYHVQFDSPTRWINASESENEGPGGSQRFSSKMQIVAEVGGAAAMATYTPKPGLRLDLLPGEKPWYEQAWKDRYGNEECYDDEGEVAECTPPTWPAIGPRGRNSPVVKPFDDADESSFDNEEGNIDPDRRYFKANWGGLHGNGNGWLGNLLIVFETGPVVFGFEDEQNAPILPEEQNGEGEVGIFYDGWVEYDDLPSSKYHQAGDQWFGEITSPTRSWYGLSGPSVQFLAGSDRYDPAYGDGLLRIPAIWGEDKGPHRPNLPTVGRDGVTPAAGPYAVNIHGSLGRDGGNVMLMELLTWRPWGKNGRNNGLAWETTVEGFTRFHPYAGPSGENLGFRDYNLDGLIDQGEVRPAGSDNYVADAHPVTTNNGTNTLYPFNRRRLVEDCIELLDDGGFDFDEYVDPVALDAVTCGGGPSSIRAFLPVQYWSPTQISVFPSGLNSGIVLLPNEAQAEDEFPTSPWFYPIHNEDGLGDPQYESSSFPKNGPQISWNIFFHDLVFGLDQSGEGGVLESTTYHTPYSAHEYLHAWERFPDLYDYDIYSENGPEINCPVAAWDIMASGGLVHPVPILKEGQCTGWIDPVDLTTVLTPGVEKEITLPPAEFTRDDSYYFLESPVKLNTPPGDSEPQEFVERFYFWSAGRGFDERMPGSGMLILHTDTAANSEATPPQQRFGSHFAYYIVQADGLDNLTPCEPDRDTAGDAGDPWPGSSGNKEFNCDTNPPSRWYAGDACTGLSISDVVPDQQGSVRVAMNWLPTDVPSLRFDDPPGGVSVGNPPSAVYQVRVAATDQFGGTWIRLFYSETDPLTNEPEDLSIRADGSNFIGMVRKITPGRSQLTADWNVSGLADGQYVVFAELIPGMGADNKKENSVNTPRAGRNNQGDGTIQVQNVNVNQVVKFGERGFANGVTFNAVTDTGSLVDFGSSVAIGDQLMIGNPNSAGKTYMRRITGVNGDRTQLTLSGSVSLSGQPWRITKAGKTARSETWQLKCVKGNDGVCNEWQVFSSLTQPVPLEEGANPDPYPHAFTNQVYTASNGSVSFRIVPGATPYQEGDTFTFTTAGITAPSRGVTVLSGRITESPVAKIVAGPLAGDPPLTVSFDGRNSRDPNGEPLQYRWDFGDGSPPATGPQQSHTFSQARTFTVTLRVTNPRTTLFGETSVDVAVTNNRPNAEITATPTSGRAPLLVSFNGANSSDDETEDPEKLTFQWQFGDGESANNQAVPGTSFAQVIHLYSARSDGTPCTPQNPCAFTATLTVTDEGGKQHTANLTINVGNTIPIVSITHGNLRGADPHEVVFNSLNTVDPDGDPICIEWNWGDHSPNECWPPRGADGATNGSVPHTYVLSEGETSGQFTTTATIRDYPGLSGSISGCDGSCTGITNGAVGKRDWPGVLVEVSERDLGPSTPNARFVVIPSPPLLDEQFVVDASSSSDRPASGQITKYTWDWDDGTSESTGIIASHTYSEPGTYTISLKVEDNENPPNTDVTTKTVTVIDPDATTDEEGNRPPIARMTASSTLVGPGQIITFSAKDSSDADGDPLTYSWTFGDGDTATGSEVTHAYNQAGAYAVRLTVRDDRSGINSTSLNITVSETAGPGSRPIAIIATGPRTGIAPVTIAFDGGASYDPDGDLVTYQWTVSNGGVVDPAGSQTTRNLFYMFTQLGIYNISLVVRDASNTVSLPATEMIRILTEEDEPQQPNVNDNDNDNGNANDNGSGVQPTRLCGIGMLTSLLGTFLGLVATLATRRRLFV